MNEDQKPVEMSPEGRFFGIKTTIDIGGDDDNGKLTDDLKVEVEGASDTTLEIEDEKVSVSAKPDSDKSDKSDKPDDDEESLEGYGEKVKKRIRKMRWEKGEETRRADAAEAQREEAVRVAQTLLQQNSQYRQTIETGEARLINEFQGRTQTAVENARAQYAKAHEAGDTDGVMKANEALIAASAEWKESQRYGTEYNARMAQQAQYQQQQAQYPVQPQQPPIQPPKTDVSEKAADWAADNPWFGSNEHREMTAVAYATHERLLTDEGMNANTKEYFAEIDKSVRGLFPGYFKDDSPVKNKRPSTVVAAGQRNNGARPHKITLNASEAAIAKRLGVPLDVYAKEMLKLEQ